MSDTFATLSQAVHEHFTRDPNSCINLGVSAHLDELPDPSKEWSESQAGAARSLLGRLDGLDTGALSFDEQLDVDLARLLLRFDLHDRTYTFNGRTRRQQQPCAGDVIGDGIFLLFVNDPRSAAKRIDDITRRLEAVPAYLQRLLGHLDTPVQRWVSMELTKIDGLPQLFATVVDWARETQYSDCGRLENARDEALDALNAYAQSLAKMPTTTQLHIGDDNAKKIVSLRGIDKSFSELHAMARDFLAATRDTIETLRSSLVTKYGLASETTTEELHRYLNDKYRVQLPTGSLEEVLERYQGEREQILAFIREKNLFPIPPDQDMKIMRTPAFMAPSIPAGAMMPPPPFRQGVRTSMVYLTLSEELLDEHTELSIPSMMIHEGIPGHHLQLATAAMHPSVIRRHVEANEHAEGWTTMLEDYMLDVGYKEELADEMRFCGKRDLSRIGARVAIDLYFMTGDKQYLDVGVECDLSSDDPFVAAGNLLQAVTGFVRDRISAELNWYSQERGYPLSYLTGNTMVWELKRDLAEAQKGKLSAAELDKRFHEVYLRSGNMPLTFLRRVFQNEGLLS